MSEWDADTEHNILADAARFADVYAALNDLAARPGRDYHTSVINETTTPWSDIHSVTLASVEATDVIIALSNLTLSASATTVVGAFKHKLGSVNDLSLAKKFDFATSTTGSGGVDYPATFIGFFTDPTPGSSVDLKFQWQQEGTGTIYSLRGQTVVLQLKRRDI